MASMFTRDDFRIDSIQDFLEFLPIVLFIGLVGPFLIGAYTVGFFMNVTGWLKSEV